LASFASNQAVLAGAAALVDSSARDDDRPFWRGAPIDPWTPTPDSLFGFRVNRAAGSKVRVHSPDGSADFLVAANPDWTWTFSSDLVQDVLDVQWGRRSEGTVVMGSSGRLATVTHASGDIVAFRDGDAVLVSMKAPSVGSAGTASDGSLRAPMPGKIVATPAKSGDVVTKGQPVIVLEAMKMEHALNAPFDGVVGEVVFAVGDQVAADAVLAVVEASA
jgi:acetyl/propionyl-CoA carboxylase alpha subunit